MTQAKHTQNSLSKSKEKNMRTAVKDHFYVQQTSLALLSWNIYQRANYFQNIDYR